MNSEIAPLETVLRGNLSSMLSRTASRLRIAQAGFARRNVSASRAQDITGNMYRCSTPQVIGILDGAMIEIMSSNKDVRRNLTELLKIDETCSLARALRAFESLRYDSSNDGATAIAEDLQQLDDSLKQGSLGKREAWYAAAGLAWFEGYYCRAGALLESAVMENPGDLLAVKLAQEVYIKGGRSDYALGCLLRHPSMMDVPSHLNPSLLGVLCAGYVETGRDKQAETDAERAVEASRGENGWALHALLNVYQVAGRSAEVYSKLDEYERGHEDSTGRANLLFNRGSAHILRGNYTAAFKTIETLMDTMQVEVDGRSTVCTPAWTNAVLLLWQLSLNTTDINPNTFDPLWRVLSLCVGRPSTPLHYLCASIVYSCAAVAQPTPTASPTTTTPTSTTTATPSTELDAPEESIPNLLLAKFKRAFLPPKRARTGNASNDNLTDRTESLKSVHDHILKWYREQLAQVERSGVHFETKLTEHLEEMRTQERLRIPSITHLRAMNPSLTALSTVQLTPQGAPALPADCSDLQYSLRTAVLPLSEALHAFNQQDFPRAAQMFLQLAPQMHLIGGTAVQRMIFEQMAVEALYRSGDNKMATLLLHERSVLVPNDAQCWRRLATLYGENGQEVLAHKAHYNAWQLGIGQGGFGGPR